MENPVIGKPFVVILVDDPNFKVEVLHHADSFEAAAGFIDELDEDTIVNKSPSIVRDSSLVASLITERQKQAARMEAVYKFGEYGFNRAWRLPPG